MLKQLRYELKRTLREVKQWVIPFTFMVMMTVMFPLALGVGISDFSRIAPGLLWCVVLLVSIFMMEGLFAPDFEEGLIAQYCLGRMPLWQYVVCKGLAHSVGLASCLVLSLPVCALFLQLSWSLTLVLALTLWVGLPALSFIGAFAASLLMGVRRSGLLVGVVLMPLYAPVLIFSISVMDNARLGMDYLPSLALLGAYSLFHMALMPYVTASSLRAGEMG